MTSPNPTSSKNWALVLTAAAAFLVVLDAMVVAVALGSIRTDLGASLEQLEWVLNAFNLSFAALLLTGAAIGDRIGRRRTLGLGLALFIIASVGCALAGNAAWLIAAKLLQGASAALVTPVAMAILSNAFPPQERARALGLFASVTGLALIVGPIVGGAIAEGLVWQWIFWINLPVGILLIPLVGRHIEESFGPGTAIDSVGVALVTLAAIALVWGLMSGNHAGWASPEVLCTVLLGVVAALAFSIWETRVAAPMVPPRFFQSRAFSSGIGAVFLYTAALYGMLFFLPQFLQIAQGHSPLQAGLRLLPWTATLFVVAPISGRMVNRLGERLLIVTGLLLQAAGMAWIGLIATPDVAYGNLILPLITAGAGVSLAMPAAQSAVLNAVARPEVGQASGIFNMFRFLGGVTGIAIAVAVFGWFGAIGGAQSFSAGFGPAILASAGISLIGAIVGLCQPPLARPAPAPSGVGG